jgi:hypothetical protein
MAKDGRDIMDWNTERQQHRGNRVAKIVNTPPWEPCSIQRPVKCLVDARGIERATGVRAEHQAPLLPGWAGGQPRFGLLDAVPSECGKGSRRQVDRAPAPRGLGLHHD